MLNIIVTTAYVFSVFSFLLFLYLVLTRPTSSPPSKPEGLADSKPQGALRDMANLVEALSKLTDSFAKAGPLVMALVSAIFFLLIAVIGSGFDSLVATFG